MKKTDLEYLCTTIGNLSGIPIRIYEGENQTFSYSIVRLPKDPMELYRKSLWEIKEHVSYYATPNFSYYGLVNHGATKIIIGPTRQLPETDQELRELAFQLALSGDEVRTFENAMRAIVHMPIESVLQMLCTINHVLTGEKLELKDLRCDGSAMSVYNIIAVALVGICTGIFNGLIARAGYVAPAIVDGVTMAAEQSQAVKNVFTFGFVGLEAITGVVLAVLLLFLNVEKDIGKEQAEIKARREEQK